MPFVSERQRHRRPSRRTLLAAAVAAAALPAPALAQGAARVVVIGGGFAGATAARSIKRQDPKTSVTLVTDGTSFTACPFSNLVVAGLRDMEAQTFRYDALVAEGIEHVPEFANVVDGAKREVAFRMQATLSYDRLVLAPGIQTWTGDVAGYDTATDRRMPHAWSGGQQTMLLRRQLEDMADGGLVVMAVPANPYRCPPGPYERASLIAHYLKTRKPRSKLLILDAKDQFSKQRLFQDAWKALYPEHLEWVGLSNGGKVTSVDAAAMTLTTDFGTHTAAVANVIPRQAAGMIAQRAGVADRTGWCPVDPVTFESRLVPGIHVIGDAAIMGAMPKSAFAANAQAKVCAAAIVDLLAGRTPQTPKLINTCYSLVAPDYGISVAGVYEPAGDVLAEVRGAGGTSPAQAPPLIRKLEAGYAETWFKTITTEVFG